MCSNVTCRNVNELEQTVVWMRNGSVFPAIGLQIDIRDEIKTVSVKINDPYPYCCI